MPVALLIAATLCTLIIPLTRSVWLDVTLVIASISCISIRLSMSRKWPLLAFLVLTAAPIIGFIKWLQPSFEAQATSVAYRTLNSELDIAESAIDRFFHANESALDSIGILISQNQDVSADQYNRWLSQILPTHRNQFLNVALSDGLTLQYVYPLTDANKRIIGIDLSTVKGQGALYQHAYKTRHAAVIGPVMLLQGVPGIIYVRPVLGNSTKLISGVLSLQYLKNELTALVSSDTLFVLNIETATQNLQLMNNMGADEAHRIQRTLILSEITINMSASSKEVDRLITQTRLVTTLSAAAFWLVSTLVIVWQYQNYQVRESNRLALKESESDLIAAQRLGQMGSWSRDRNSRMKLSEPLQELLHFQTEEIDMESFLDQLHPQEYETVHQQIEDFFTSHKSQLALEHRLLVNGDYHWFEHRIARNHLNESTGILRDIQSLRIRDEQVAQLESFDSLTGAANRHYFKQLTIQNIALCERRRTALSLVLVNIDDFRTVNEKYGQLSGDELLKQVVHRLQATSRKTDTVARLSGDTFAISLNDIGNNKQTVLVIENILRQLKEPYILADDLYPQFTIGASMFPNDGHNYDTLLRMAESALSNAKTEARGHYRFYSAELSEQTDRRQKILSSLPAAIRNNYLSLLFQPRVMSAKPDNTTSMEVLVRWTDPKLGVVSPGEFIPIAEQTSLIADIGHWVMEQTFAMVAKYHNELPEAITISINLSPRQLEDASLVNNVKLLLEQYQVNANQFELEITEYSISEQSDAILSHMHLLSDLGFQFAMDDFGTGYSNLSILQSLPLNVLKIDMSFIRAIGTTAKSDELVKAIVNMGHTLGLRVVAEGVESAAQVQFLNSLTCEELQGYYFFKPAPIEKLLPYLKITD